MAIIIVLIWRLWNINKFYYTFDHPRCNFNVAYSSCWGYSLINTLKLKNAMASFLGGFPPPNVSEKNIFKQSTRTRNKSADSKSYCRSEKLTIRAFHVHIMFYMPIWPAGNLSLLATSIWRNLLITSVTNRTCRGEVLYARDIWFVTEFIY